MNITELPRIAEQGFGALRGISAATLPTLSGVQVATAGTVSGVAGIVFGGSLAVHAMRSLPSAIERVEKAGQSTSLEEKCLSRIHLVDKALGICVGILVLMTCISLILLVHHGIPIADFRIIAGLTFSVITAKGAEMLIRSIYICQQTSQFHREFLDKLKQSPETLIDWMKSLDPFFLKNRIGDSAFSLLETNPDLNTLVKAIDRGIYQTKLHQKILIAAAIFMIIGGTCSLGGVFSSIVAASDHLTVAGNVALSLLALSADPIAGTPSLMQKLFERLYQNHEKKHPILLAIPDDDLLSCVDDDDLLSCSGASDDGEGDQFCLHDPMPLD